MKTTRTKPPAALAKARTGIRGLDEITGGGLPAGRPTLVCGAAGAGKTLLAMEFLLRGATELGEPGVFITFEESAEELARNFASLGHDLATLQRQKKLAIDFVRIERSEIEEIGDYDLEGLFLRLGHAIDSIGARRVVLDTVEALFAGFTNQAVLRSELRRLFRWLKERGITAIVTGERGDGMLTRHGLEEYVADCVLALDHRVTEGIATRRLRIVKYRGSGHGSGEYPFLIDGRGISILPITSLLLRHEASTRRISSGVPRLDAMLGGSGYYRGSSILVSGTAGSGKTSLAAHFAHATAARGERCLWLTFEESETQVVRNMRSIGVDLRPALRRGRLRFHAKRPSAQGLEAHLVELHNLVLQYRPHVVLIDPITGFAPLGSGADVTAMATRLIDSLKVHRITALFTSLTPGDSVLEQTEIGISSLMDTWILLRDLESGAERNRVLHILKSRGMAHSNQLREFRLTARGIELRDVYIGASGELLTGTSRLAQESREAAERVARDEEAARKRRQVESRRRAVNAQVAALHAGLEAELAEAERLIDEDRRRIGVISSERALMARERHADAGARPLRKAGAP